jgi:hypothetical protein
MSEHLLPPLRQDLPPSPEASKTKVVLGAFGEEQVNEALHIAREGGELDPKQAIIVNALENSGIVESTRR